MFPITGNGANVQNKFLGRMFRRITGLVWDLTTGKIGIQDKGGIYTLDITPGVKASDPDTYRPSVNPFDNFGTAIPAFAQQVPFEKIGIADIVVGDNGILGWVIDKKNVALVLMDKNGMTKNYTPPKVQIMGSEGALVVQSLFNVAGGQEGLTGLQGNLLPLMMLAGDDDSALEKILPLMLFSQSTGTGAGAMNPMMLMMMAGGLGKGGSGGGLAGMDPMMLMMMMGGMGGNNGGGMNPMMLMAMTGGLEKLTGNTVPGTGSNAIGGTPPLQTLRR